MKGQEPSQEPAKTGSHPRIGGVLCSRRRRRHQPRGSPGGDLEDPGFDGRGHHRRRAGRAVLMPRYFFDTSSRVNTHPRPTMTRARPWYPPAPTRDPPQGLEDGGLVGELAAPLDSRALEVRLRASSSALEYGKLGDESWPMSGSQSSIARIKWSLSALPARRRGNSSASLPSDASGKARDLGPVATALYGVDHGVDREGDAQRGCHGNPRQRREARPAIKDSIWSRETTNRPGIGHPLTIPGRPVSVRRTASAQATFFRLWNGRMVWASKNELIVPTTWTSISSVSSG